VVLWAKSAISPLKVLFHRLLSLASLVYLRVGPGGVCCSTSSEKLLALKMGVGADCAGLCPLPPVSSHLGLGHVTWWQHLCMPWIKGGVGASGCCLPRLLCGSVSPPPRGRGSASVLLPSILLRDLLVLGSRVFFVDPPSCHPAPL